MKTRLIVAAVVLPLLLIVLLVLPKVVAVVLGQPGSPPTAWTAVTEVCERRALSSILGWPLLGAGGCSQMAGGACFPRAQKGWQEVLWGGKQVSSSCP